MWQRRSQARAHRRPFIRLLKRIFMPLTWLKGLGSTKMAILRTPAACGSAPVHHGSHVRSLHTPDRGPSVAGTASACRCSVLALLLLACKHSVFCRSEPAHELLGESCAYRDRL